MTISNTVGLSGGATWQQMHALMNNATTEQWIIEQYLCG